MAELTLRYVGFYVQDIRATLDFYARAFGFETRYVHPSGGYAELATGDTLLAFVSEKFLETTNLLGGAEIVFSRRGKPLIGAQIALVTQNLDGDWSRAVEAGATVLMEPEPKPWGQAVGYLQDLNGAIVELQTRSPRG